MKKKLSISHFFQLMGLCYFIITFVLCIVIYMTIKKFEGVFICFSTASILAIWAVILVNTLQKKLVSFTEDICQTIDNMIKEDINEQLIFDEDTMLDRINHQLNRLYQTLNAHKYAIKTQQADLQSMICDVSHQVKTPITNLKMAVSTLIEQEMSRKEQLYYFSSINMQLDKLDFLMNAMIKSSRLETGIIKLKKQKSSIYETLAIALGSIYLQAEEKKLQIIVDCPEKIMINHDEKWTAEALFNVLENAVKYTQIGGTIKIRVHQWEAYTKIDITDNGRGIPESHWSKIFKRFYREPEVHNIDGIGIGLYLTRKIILKQDGRIYVTSVVGKGTTFTIFLSND